MKKFILFSLLVCISTLLSAQLLQIDDQKTTVSFLFLDDEVEGILSNFKFNGTLNFEDLESSSISGTVNSETIDTNNWLRNRHLRKKYFKVEEFPVLSFKSDSITASEELFKVKGTLTIKGIERAVVFTLSRSPKELELKASVNTSDFDILIHDETNRNAVDIVIVMPYAI
jgi:polyisoprenoid-binding protein YceI